MNILIVGGTLFLGRRLVEAALARDHQITIFTRGRHNAGIHAGVETLKGDRNGDVSALRGRQWDAAIDAYLLERGVQPWSELPLWIPDSHNGIFEVRNDKAIANGLTFRPLKTTVRDTLEWDRLRRRDELMKAGLPRDRERDLLNDASHPAH